ncbi:MAG TPA: hypothetical protein VEI97_07965, partial [bacterium]|nr:hypothetical protein [bacterium]
AVIQQTGPVNPGAGYQPGDGDPRFGLRGNTMGNGLDHTMVYTVYPGERFGPSDRETQIVETCRTLKCSTGNQVVAKGFTELLEIDNEDRDDNNGTHWMMGGRRIINSQGEVDTVFTHWPGNFFYRGFPERQALRKGWTIDEPNWYSHLSVSRYLMGVYGSYTTAGVDLIRLEKTDTLGNHIRYRLPGPFGGYQFFMTWWPTAWYRGGMPEVAGGGSESQGPWLPYDGSKEYPGQFIYGCPDGLADGIILVLTAGDEVQAYRE